MSNDKGGLLKAKKQFLQDLKMDDDFIKYSNYQSVTYENLYNYSAFSIIDYWQVGCLKSNRKIITTFGVIGVDSGLFLGKRKKINNIIKDFL